MSIMKKTFEDIRDRIGSEQMGRRLRSQVNLSALKFGAGFVRFHWENMDFLMDFIGAILRICGISGMAVRNTLDYDIEEIEILSDNLPDGFDGFRILQLSDLHIDGTIDRGDKLRNIVSKMDFDLCVITGDFRYKVYGDYDEMLKLMKDLIPALKCEYGIYGVLGNHDFIEFVYGLESMEIKMLLNESVSVKRGRESIWITGVDDPHFYECDDLPEAIRDVPSNAFNILLAHSPEIISTASDSGVDYYLSGHSHGGQLCMPGGIPVLTNSRCRRKYVSGAWKYKDMYGYTSRGTGSSGLPARLNCKPEITLHRLIRS